MGTVYYGADLGEKEKDFVYVINFLINMDNLLSISKRDYYSSTYSTDHVLQPAESHPHGHGPGLAALDEGPGLAYGAVHPSLQILKHRVRYFVWVLVERNCDLNVP